MDAELEAYNAARAKKNHKKDENDADDKIDPPLEEHDDILATKGYYPYGTVISHGTAVLY